MSFGCLPLGNDDEGVSMALYVRARGRDDVPELATPSGSVRADLEFVAPYLSAGCLGRWLKALELWVQIDRDKQLSKTRLEHESIRRLRAVTHRAVGIIRQELECRGRRRSA